MTTWVWVARCRLTRSLRLVYDHVNHNGWWCSFYMSSCRCVCLDDDDDDVVVRCSDDDDDKEFKWRGRKPWMTWFHTIPKTHSFWLFLDSDANNNNKPTHTMSLYMCVIAKMFHDSLFVGKTNKFWTLYGRRYGHVLSIVTAIVWPRENRRGVGRTEAYFRFSAYWLGIPIIRY